MPTYSKYSTDSMCNIPPPGCKLPKGLASPEGLLDF